MNRKDSYRNYCLHRALVYPLAIAMLLLTFCMHANGQQLTVASASARQPLANAQLTFSSLLGDQLEVLDTDASGRVANASTAKRLVTIQQMGYKSVTDTIKPGESRTFYLEDDPFNLEQVVVTGTMSQKTLKSTPVLTQLLTARQIEERGAYGIQSMLMQEVPGLSFNQGAFTTIDMQGLGAKHILFLIDGERIAGDKDGNIDYTRINPNSIERIEVVKGASSALYGSMAMGGVVNIITKKPQRSVELSIGGQLAQLNQRNAEGKSNSQPDYIFYKNLDKTTYSANLSLGVKLGQLRSQTNVLRQSADGYQLYDRVGQVKYYAAYDTTVYEPVRAQPTNISGFEDLNLSQKFFYTPNSKLSLTAKGGYYTLSTYDFVNNGMYELSRDFTYGASADYRLTSESNVLLSLHSDSYSRYNKSEVTDWKEQIYGSRLLQPRLVASTAALKNQTLMGGVEYLGETLDANRFKSNDGVTSQSQWSVTAFVQDDWQVSNRFSVVGGVRTDYHEAYGFHATPKLSLMYLLKPLTLRASYAQGYRSPSIKELYMDWDHNGMFRMYGNENLHPETNTYFSLSAEYTSSWLGLIASGYGSWFRNKIEEVWTMDQRECRYENIGKTRVAGVDFTGKAIVTRGLSLNTTLSYLYTAKDENGLRLSAANPFTANVRLEYHLAKGAYGATVNLTGFYVAQKSFDVLGNIKLNGGKKVDAYYRVQLPDYSMWGLSITQLFYRSIRLTVGVDNLFGYTADVVSFNSSTSIGRRFYLSLNMSIDRLLWTAKQKE